MLFGTPETKAMAMALRPENIQPTAQDAMVAA